MSEKHFWTVRCAIPTKHGNSDREYMGNHNLGVATATIDEAIAAVRQHHPRSQIWAVNHHGKIEVES